MHRARTQHNRVPTPLIPVLLSGSKAALELPGLQTCALVLELGCELRLGAHTVEHTEMQPGKRVLRRAAAVHGRVCAQCRLRCEKRASWVLGETRLLRNDVEPWG